MNTNHKNPTATGAAATDSFMDLHALSDAAMAAGMFTQLTGSAQAQQQDSLNSHGANGVPRMLQLDFEKEEKKIQQFENINKKFHKDVKTYIDRIDDLNKSEAKMINNLNNFITQSDKNASSTSTLTSAAAAANAAASASAKSPGTSQLSTPSSTDLHGSGRKSSVSTLHHQRTTSIDPSSSSSASASASSSQQLTMANEEDFTEKFKVWRDILQLHNKSCESLKQSCQSKVIEPIKKLNMLFPNVYSAIKRREHAYKEFLSQQNRLNRAQEKERTGPNLVRIEEYKQSANAAKQQFLKEHLFLMEELPKLYNSRLEYIKPCVHSLLESQSNFYETYASFYDKILSSNKNNTATTTGYNSSLLNRSFSLPKSGSDALASNRFANTDELDNEINEYLSQIKELSIVAGD